MVGNLKAARRGFGGNLVGGGRHGAEAALAADDAFCENSRDLLESLLGRQFVEWCFWHCDRLRVSWPVGLCMSMLLWVSVVPAKKQRTAMKPTVLFMPWCPIVQDYSAEQLSLVRFDPDTPPADVAGVEWDRICRLLSPYKDINGQPIQRAALIRFGDRRLTAEVTSEELEAVADVVSLVCFASLANRGLLRSGWDYCNSDNFTLYAQRFDTAEDVSITTRRRDGRERSSWRVCDLSITVPVHCANVQSIYIDEALLAGLLAQRRSLPETDWARWQNAITCFNSANTDSDNIRPQVEWLLLCSALEHLLNAKSNAASVARRFDEALVPPRVIPANTCRRPGMPFSNSASSLRNKWVREFYRVRGDFAHGRLNVQQPLVWTFSEHLLLATLAFPLVIKSLLSKSGFYELSDDDAAQIACFEQLADTPQFLETPSNPTRHGDSHWGRLLEQHREDQFSAKLRERFRDEDDSSSVF